MYTFGQQQQQFTAVRKFYPDEFYAPFHSVYSYSYVSDDNFLFFFVFDIIAESACLVSMIWVSFFHKIVDRP